MIQIICAEFNSEITEKLLESAEKILQKNGEKFAVALVPGAAEIPIAAQKILQKEKKISAIVALGCVIKGDTDHYEFVSKICADGILRVALDFSTPIIFGVLMCRDFHDAWQRREHGAEFAETAIFMKNNF